jgi:hypothetical protein
MHEGKSPLGKPRAYPVSLASGKPHLVRLSLFGSGLSGLGLRVQINQINVNAFTVSSLVTVKEELAHPGIVLLR